MRRRMPAAAAMLVGIMTAGTVALAGTGMAATSSAPRIHVINLHLAFEHALPSARMLPHPRAGIVPVIGTGRHRTAAAGCSEPNCDLLYNGGPVQHSPQVFLLLWGASWTNTDPAVVQMVNMFSGLGGTHDYWSPVTRQYGDGSGTPGPSAYAGAWQDTAAEPDPVSPANLAAEADGFASFLNTHGFTVTNDSQIVVASPSGMCFTDGFGGNCGAPQSTGYCAWHSYSNEPFVNMAYQLDAGAGCGQNFVNAGSAGTYDGTSIVGGHEFTETITDPQAGSGWLDGFDSVSGGEIGDKCAWGGQVWGGHDPVGNVTLSTGTFAMQSLWSNAAGGCVMTNDALTIAPIGSKATVVNIAASFPLHATSTDGAAICCWSASGLPPGTQITSAGVITGKPTQAGSYVVTVQAGDAALSSASQQFTWTVKGDTLTIAPVGRKVTIVRRLVHIAVHATSSAGVAICCWAARGLPRGVRITARGVITGRPQRTGRYVVTVRAKDAALSVASRRFTWIVKK